MSTPKGGVLMYICAGLLFTGGFLVSVLTTWYLLRVSYFFWLSDFGFELGAGMLLVAGGILCFPIGWLAIMLPERVYKSLVYNTLLCLVVVSMMLMTTGMSISSGLSRGLRDPDILNKSMLQAMSSDNDYYVKKAFSNMQIELKCCGVNSHVDWFKHRYHGGLPPSCCGRVMTGNKESTCVVSTFNEGCLIPAQAELRRYMDVIATFTYSLVFLLAGTLAAMTYVVMKNWQVTIHLPSVTTPHPHYFISRDAARL